MKIKDFTEKCSTCPCKSCSNAYRIIDEKIGSTDELCYDWCENNCKGKHTVIESYTDSCFRSMN